MISSEKPYKNFIFFSAGPVGDHTLLVDHSNRFFESTGIPSTILNKHPSKFLKDISLPYADHIDYIDVIGFAGVMRMFVLAIKSLFNRYCYVLVLPIPPPTYFKVFARYIRFCTPSKFIGLNLEGSRNFPVGYGSAYFLGKENYIPSNLDKELFYEQANRLLQFLNFKPVSRKPTLEYIPQQNVFGQFGISPKEYVVFHPCSSHPDRSFPIDRWQHIVTELRNKFPALKFVFTGSPADKTFIQLIIDGVNVGDKSNMIVACGVSMQELLTIYASAKLNVTVHTGNAILINELHVPTVILNIKGIYMFKYYYNELSTELVSTKDCTCDPYERQCTMIPYKGQEYMACLFNIPAQDVIDTVTSKLQN